MPGRIDYLDNLSSNDLKLEDYQASAFNHTKARQEMELVKKQNADFEASKRLANRALLFSAISAIAAILSLGVSIIILLKQK